ncbi:MAG: DUF483 domain-containing protein [Thermoprotei archaeon]|nr:MAG: DUF483 domain-containing protein [Thermoprotei archaeon]
MKGLNSFKRIIAIIDNIKELVASIPLNEALNQVRKLYANFTKVAQLIAEAFSSGILLEIYERLKIELSLVEKYNPPVRPALDPEFALTLRLYSLDDVEVGKFLGYPECCIRSFVDDCRLFFDKEHLRELDELRRKGLKVVVTAGFIPCSLYCEKAIESGLLGHLEDFSEIRLLDDELKKKLPHSHSAYQSFYEFLC